MAASVLRAIAEPVQPDWESLKWGMSLEQLAVVNSMRVQLIPKKYLEESDYQKIHPISGKVMAQAPYELPEHPGNEGMFEFIFDDNRLIAVRDTFPDYDPHKTLTFLIGSYGRPVEAFQSRSGRRKDFYWIDESAGNKVWYTVFSGPSLAYETIFYTSKSNESCCDILESYNSR